MTTKRATPYSTSVAPAVDFKNEYTDFSIRLRPPREKSAYQLLQLRLAIMMEKDGRDGHPLGGQRLILRRKLLGLRHQ